MDDGDFMARIAKGCPYMGGTGKFFQWIGDRLQQSKDTKRNLTELRQLEAYEEQRHKEALGYIQKRRRDIQGLCDHVYDETPDGLPDVGHIACQVCGYEKHSPA